MCDLQHHWIPAQTQERTQPQSVTVVNRYSSSHSTDRRTCHQRRAHRKGSLVRQFTLASECDNWRSRNDPSRDHTEWHERFLNIDNEWRRMGPSLFPRSDHPVGYWRRHRRHEACILQGEVVLQEWSPPGYREAQEKTSRYKRWHQRRAQNSPYQERHDHFNSKGSRASHLHREPSSDNWRRRRSPSLFPQRDRPVGHLPYREKWGFHNNRCQDGVRPREHVSRHENCYGRSSDCANWRQKNPQTSCCNV